MKELELQVVRVAIALNKFPHEVRGIPLEDFQNIVGLLNQRGSIN